MNEISYYRHFNDEKVIPSSADEIFEIVTGRNTDVTVYDRDKKANIPLEIYTDKIRRERQEMIDKGYDKGTIKKRSAKTKKALPCVAWSSLMTPNRGAEYAVSHSDLICVDFDGLTKSGIDTLWDNLLKDPHVLLAFLSPSGAGLKVVVPVAGQAAWVPEGEQPQAELNKALQAYHAAAVKAVWHHLEPLGVEVDEACKDISRLCFLCHDEQAYYNPKAVPLAVPGPTEADLEPEQPAARKEAPSRNSKAPRALPEEREEQKEGVPDWLDSALEHLKDEGMTHLEKVTLVYGLSHIYGGSDEGLDVAHSFFNERRTGEPLDEKEIETEYFKDGDGCTAGTIWHIAKEKGWQPPRREAKGREKESEPGLTDALNLLPEADEGLDKQIAKLPEITGASTLLEEKFKPDLPLVKGMMDVADVMMISGSSKSKKTFWQIQFGLCVSTGKPFVGMPTFEGRNVLYVNLELKPWQFQKRLKAAMKRLHIVDASRLKVWSLRGYWMSTLMLRYSLTKYVHGLKEEDRPHLIIIDPIYKLLAGVDENSMGEVGDCVRHFDGLARDTRAAVLYANHFAKGSQDKKMEQDRAGGSRVMSAFPDVGMNVLELDEPDTYRIEIYQRNYPPIEEFGAQWEEGAFIPCEHANLNDLKKGIKGGRKPTATPEQIRSLFPDGPPDVPAAKARVASVFKVSTKTAGRLLTKAYDDESQDSSTIPVDKV